MKCVILAGGRGSRLGEESHLRPKPMIEIGGQPILWHIMKTYGHHGVNEFVVCLGYRGYLIKEYFLNYCLHTSDVTVELQTNTVAYHDVRAEPWRVTLVDTGPTTETGGRLKRVRPYLDPEEPFCMTYGDGLADVDIAAQVSFHEGHGRWATMTVVRPPARFGRASVEGERVTSFDEKPDDDGDHINGGFFVLAPTVLDLVEGDDTAWEHAPLERLAAMDQLRAWRHDGFWRPMDTARDREYLESQWTDGGAPWRVWD